MTNPSPYPISPVKIIDAALAQLNTRLTDGSLAWLETAYGQAEKRVKEKEGKNYNYPSVYVGAHGKGDYLDLMPDEHLLGVGAYSFWDVKEPVKIDVWNQDSGQLRFDAGLVVWFDFRKVYPSDWQGRTVWNVVQDVLDVLKYKTGFASIGNELEFYYSGESIYQRYTHNEIKRQFLMKPYGGFRIDMTIFYQGTC